MLSEEIRHYAEKIAEFYLSKNGGDYEAAANDVLRLLISKLEVVDGKLEITAGRVGLLIGKRGTNVDDLIKYLGIGIKIIEDYDSLGHHLIPYPKSDDFADYDPSWPEDDYDSWSQVDDFHGY